MGLLIVNSLWLIAVDPHRGGSISLRPYFQRSCHVLWDTTTHENEEFRTTKTWLIFLAFLCAKDRCIMEV